MDANNGQRARGGRGQEQIRSLLYSKEYTFGLHMFMVLLYATVYNSNVCFYIALVFTVYLLPVSADYFHCTTLYWNVDERPKSFRTTVFTFIIMKEVFAIWCKCFILTCLWHFECSVTFWRRCEAFCILCVQFWELCVEFWKKVT